MSLFYSEQSPSSSGAAVQPVDNQEDNNCYSQRFTNAFTSLTDLGMQYFTEMIAPKTEDSTMEKKRYYAFHSTRTAVAWQ
uniref:Uncharacterized protein n=1 Tax=Ditylenchus dipsaci TaxID=166011 RepID=A0A915E211_9BILA